MDISKKYEDWNYMYLLYYGFILSNEKNDGTILTLVNRVVTHVKQFLSMHVFLGSTQCFCLLEKNSEQPFFFNLGFAPFPTKSG